MRTCSHCGTGKSPCWRRGPPEKPMLCNACGAHYLVKRSLDGYMPGQRTSSPTPSGSSQQMHSENKRQKHQVQQLQCQTDTDTTGSTCTASSVSAGSMLEQQTDFFEVEQPAVVSSRKRSRLVACSVYEVDPLKDCVLRCKRTFETPDGGVVTVVRRMRKQLKPRASWSS